MESPQHLSLHIPHFLDEFVAQAIHVTTEFGAEFSAELVQVFLGCGAVFFSRHEFPLK